jgi:LysM repeat protein
VTLRHLRGLISPGLLGICWLALAGCDAAGPGAVDEEKEPQFLIGRSRVNAMNFQGAIEAFEQALEMNPHSGAAHFELGWLHAEKENDPAAAIYHYQKYLELRPTASNAETIRQHVFRLKQELAKGVLPIPSTPELQDKLEQVTRERDQLLAENSRLRSALTPAANTNRAGASASSLRPGGTGVQANSPRFLPTPTPSGDLTHRVKAGDTLASIAREHRVSLEALTTANPGLNPRRLQVGQSLRVPRP